jgi:lysyl-tRNA synthetase class 2
MQTDHWPPSATIETLKQRGKIIQTIRQFFYEREVLEVETPALSQATVTDIHLHTFQTKFVGPGYANGQTLYAMTSPEFHMKRLLAAQSGSIFQIGKAFRNEECGRYHNPEFSMLEWYRVGFDHHQLMDEMDELLQLVLATAKADRMTYQQAFLHHLNLCPLTATLEELRQSAGSLGLSDIADTEEDRDTLLQLLFSMGVETKIGQARPAFVYDFPASQAALAKINPQDPRVADRFEVYFKGIELANGFNELDNADEQLQRFKQDNIKRKQMALPEQPIDYHFIAALHSGLPNCAGVALGIDRLIMLALGKEHIDEVVAFTVGRA